MKAADDVRRLLDHIRRQAMKLPEPHRSSIDDATTLIETITAAHMVEPYDMRWRDFGMSKMESELASFMYSRLGKTVTKAQLWNSKYATDSEGGADSKIIEVYICKLRKHLKGTPFAVETVWGTGYRMVERKDGHGGYESEARRALDNLTA